MAIDSIVGVGLAVVAALALAIQSLSVRVGTKTHSVVEVVGVMYVVNLVVLVPLAGITAAPGYDVTVAALGAFAAAGVVGSLLARVCYFVSIDRLGASRTEPLKALLPLFAAITAILVLDERVTPMLVTGITILLIGGIAVSLESRTSPTTPTGRQFWIALAFPLGAAVLLGIDPVFTKLGLAAGTPVLVGATIRIGVAAVGFGGYLCWRAIRDGRFVSMKTSRWVVIAAIANTGYLLAYHGALARSPVTVVTPVVGSSTVFVVAGAAGFMQRDERVTFRLVGAALLVVIGVVLVVAG